jgi:uncharacterized protein
MDERKDTAHMTCDGRDPRSENEPAKTPDTFSAALPSRNEDPEGGDAPLLARVIRCSHAIREVAGDHGASNVRLFGSLARGAETEGSDIDLLVTLEPGRTLFDLARLRSRLEEILEASVDVVPDTNMDESLMIEIERDAIRL